MMFEELKQDIIREFWDKDNTYASSDRLYVVIHELVDDYVCKMDLESALDTLKLFNLDDYRNVDRGLYEGVLEKDGLEKFLIVLTYCLIEQELLNDEEVNELQNVEEVNGVVLR